MPNEKIMEIAGHIDDVVMLLTKASVGVPVITEAVISVIKIVQALKGTAPPLDSIIAKIKAQAELNNVRGQAIIAQLEAEIAASKQS